MNDTIAGVDLAKDVIQVCIYSNQQVRSNTEMTPPNFLQWLANAKPMRIVFEACGTSNYWKQKSCEFGHDAQLISAKLVGTVRQNQNQNQNQKNDKNDALAIIQAAMLPNIQFIAGKDIVQQQMQSVIRLRELSIKQKTALHNQLTALLLEFNIRVSNKNGGLRGAIESTLEDAENGLSNEFREAIKRAWMQYLEVISSITVYDSCLEKSIKEAPQCQKLLDIEGIGVINAINLYNILSSPEDAVFKSGKDAAACIGLTPVQHSSGGKTKLGSIGKHVRNKTLRSQLVTGAFTYINHVNRRQPRTKKEVWLKALIARRGKKCAAVALANKSVRTAFAILANNTVYKAEPV